MSTLLYPWGLSVRLFLALTPDPHALICNVAMAILD